MNAHDKLERQLRASVRRNAGGHRRPAVLFAGIPVAVTLAIVVIVVLALNSGSARPIVHPQIRPQGRADAGTGVPGPVPRNADEDAVANAFNQVLRQDRACDVSGSIYSSGKVSDASPGPGVLATVPALARPATTSDRLPSRFYRAGRLSWPFLGEIYQRFIRRARVVGRTSFYLVPESGLGNRPRSAAVGARCQRLEIAALAAQLPEIPAAKRSVTRRYGAAEFAAARYNLERSRIYGGIDLLQIQAHGGGGAVETVASIRKGQLMGGGVGAKPSSPVVIDGIVPGGVAEVMLKFPATTYKRHHLPALALTGKVVNDVLVVPVPALVERGGWPAVAIWRSASGQVIKTIDERPFRP